jgi:hypothetical protein
MFPWSSSNIFIAILSAVSTWQIRAGLVASGDTRQEERICPLGLGMVNVAVLQLKEP